MNRQEIGLKENEINFNNIYKKKNWKINMNKKARVADLNRKVMREIERRGATNLTNSLAVYTHY